jgi:hypothetical protein
LYWSVTDDDNKFLYYIYREYCYLYSEVYKRSTVISRYYSEVGSAITLPINEQFYTVSYSVSLSELFWSLVVHRLSVRLLHFRFLLQTRRTNYNQSWRKLFKGDSELYKWRTTPSPRGENSKQVKILWKCFKVFFSRTRWPISIKLGTNHS